MNLNQSKPLTFNQIWDELKGGIECTYQREPMTRRQFMQLHT